MNSAPGEVVRTARLSCGHTWLQLPWAARRRFTGCLISLHAISTKASLGSLSASFSCAHTAKGAQHTSLGRADPAERNTKSADELRPPGFLGARATTRWPERVARGSRDGVTNVLQTRRARL